MMTGAAGGGIGGLSVRAVWVTSERGELEIAES